MPPLQRERIFRPPGFEELNQLLSGRIVVPGAVLPHDLKQMIHGFAPLASRVKREGELEPGLPILGIGGDSLFQAFDIRFRPRLLREVQRRLCAAIALGSLLRGWNQSERLLRSIQIPGLNIAFRKPRDRARRSPDRPAKSPRTEPRRRQRRQRRTPPAPLRGQPRRPHPDPSRAQ